jgi:hypothetical protein
MMRASVILLLLCLATAPLRGELQLYLADGGTETAVGTTLNFAATNQSDPVTRTFRLRNAAAVAAPVRVLEVAGTGFSLAAPVTLPQTLASGDALEFAVVFRGSSESSYSAVLRSEGISVLLTATVTAQVTVAVKTSTGAVSLAAGDSIGFGEVACGSSATTRILFRNLTARDQAIPTLTIQGSDFRLAAAAPSGVLHSLEEAAADLLFTPSATGSLTGTFTAGNRSFVLSGTGLEVPLPTPSLSLTLAKTESGQQGSVAVGLSETARTSGAGTVTLSFEPLLAGVSDTAIVFSNGTRTTAFSVASGDTQGHFGDYTAAAFQTGTSAGTLTVTVQLGTASVQQTIVIPPAAPAIDSVTATRTTAGLEIQIAGFDNTRSAGLLAFTFYTSAGTAIPPGTISADASAALGTYFQSSDLGGLFLLTADFPVTGDTSTVAAVEVAVTNSTGTVKSARIQF